MGGESLMDRYEDRDRLIAETRRLYDLRMAAGEPMNTYTNVGFVNRIDMWIDDYQEEYGEHSLDNESVESVAQKIVQKMYITSSKQLKALNHSIETQFDSIDWDAAREWAKSYVFDNDPRNEGLTNNGLLNAVNKIEAYLRAKQDLMNWLATDPDAKKYYFTILYHFTNQKFDSNSPTEVDEELEELF
jgi:hypothetical protein